jgi:alpha-D-ribose 1-methylphosphonate 5-triphosphate synthase subunit PhnH
MQDEALRSGFADPVFDAQATFRAAMTALAQPGTVHEITAALGPPHPLHVGTAALVLALCDNDTPLWLDRQTPAAETFLRFHTGAKLVSDASAAAFAIAADGRNIPSWNELAIGTLEYPDRSTTLIVQLDTLTNDNGWHLSGPGIKDEARLQARPLPGDFAQRLADNHRLFPRGIDLFLVAGSRIAALPRTTRVTD